MLGLYKMPAQQQAVNVGGHATETVIHMKQKQIG
jgi:hypothetical protein